MIKRGFVRHGVTRWNKEGRAQGHSDIPLDEEGRQQARLLAAHLESDDWDVVYASPWQRARETAEILNTKLKKTLHLDARLREESAGVFEGTTEEERIAKWGVGWRELNAEFEPHDSMMARGLSFMAELSDNHPEQNVLIVSHGTFLLHLLQVLLPEKDMDEHLENTSFTSLIKRENHWECVVHNHIAHLTKGESLT